MKKIYTKIKAASLLASALMLSGTISAQVITTTFSYGTVSSINTGSIGTFTVPTCVSQITIEARGASGGFNASGVGGKGARMIGVFTVTPGQVLSYLVGKSPGNSASAGFTYPGGGGGSYVANGAAFSTATPMIVAGGGGGGYNGSTGTGAPVTTSGTGPNPGTNGNGAPANSCGGGGGGFYTTGGTDMLYGFFGGQGFQQGGAGGNPNPTYAASYQPGGFGGGAPANYVGSCNYRAGSGGGYSGGSAVGTSLIDIGNAGGSFNAGTSQSNTADFNTGHGVIIFSYLLGIPIPVSATPTALCVGSTATLTASGATSYTWDSSSNANSITVNPSTTTSYTVTGTLGSCTGTSVLTLTVDPGTPTLSVVSSTNSLCLGKTATLTASGAYGYTWTNGVTNGVAFNPTVTTSYMVTGANGCGTSTAVSTITVAPLSVIMAVTPTVVCAGNVATITANTSANSYTWLPLNATGTSSSLIVGPTANTIYTVIATDGTCVGTSTVALNTLQVPTITAAATDTDICVGESVTLTATGGLNYTWTPGSSTGSVVVVSPTTPAIFSVLGDNSVGCFASSTKGIVVYALPTVALSASSPMICQGSSATLSIVSDGHTYSWSSGGTGLTEIVTPLSSSVYTAITTNTLTSCVNSQTIDVTVYIPNVTITGSMTICSGGATNLLATGATNYTWSSGSVFPTETLSPPVTTNYTVSSITSTNNLNCAGTTTFQILVNPNPTITASSERAEICKNESVTLSASGAPNLLWSNAATTPSIMITSSLITTVFYTVTGTNAQGCSTSTVVQVKVNGCTGLSEGASLNSKLDVYPNPSNGEFTIKYSSAINLNLVNELGQLVKVITLDEKNAYSQKITGLANGIYFVTGQSAQGKLNQKIIVHK